MRLYHATAGRNRLSIETSGLLPSRSQGKRPAVWLVPSKLRYWAICHTVVRHGGPVEEVVVYTVDVPRSWLKRHGKGLWYCTRPIPPERLVAATGFGLIALTGGVD
jgi:hypothetical protein